MAAFEEKSLQYYSTSLDKLDDLIELAEIQKEDNKVYQDDFMEKLKTFEKGGDMYESFKKVENLLGAVVRKNKLAVTFDENVEQASQSQKAAPESSGFFEKLIKKTPQTVNYFNNSQNDISDSIVFTDMGDPAQLESLAKVFPKSVNRITKTITKLASIDLSSIQSLNKLFEEIKAINNNYNTEIVSNISDLSRSIFRLGLGLTLMFPVYAVALLTAPIVGKALGTLLSAISESSKEADKVNTQPLLDVNKVIFTLGLQLALATPFYAIGIGTSYMFATTMEQIGKGLKSFERYAKDTEETTKNLKGLGRAILGFGISLGIAGLVYSFALLTAVPAIALTLGAIGLAFRLFPDADKTKEVSRSLIHTALGLTALALAFVVWDRAPFDAMNIVTSLVAIAAVGTTFALIGRFDKKIKSGAVAVGFMSLALIGFSLSLAASTALLGSDPISMLTNAALVGVTVGGLALVFGLIGKFAGQILMGSLAVAAMGLALLPLSFSLGMLMSVDYDWEKMAQFGVTLVGLGVTFAGAGAISPLILLGSAAFGAVGLSLIALEAGLSKFYGVENEDLTFFTEVGSDNTTGFMRLTSSISAGAREAAGFKELAGAASIGAIGLALRSLASGLEPFIGDDNALVAALDNGLGDTIARVIEAITTPFIAAGAGNENDSLVGMVFGADFGMPAAFQGAQSVIKMGEALQAIATGIQPFVGEGNAITQAIAGGNLGGKIGSFITQLTEPFIAVGGGRSSADQSLTGLIFGNDFSMSDVEEGANAVEAMGSALQAISDGISPFVGTDNAMVRAIDPANNLGKNIGDFITAITEPFIAAGDGRSSSDSSLLGLVFGNDFSMSDAEEGANSVKAMGDALQSIAKGIEPFTGTDNAIVKAINSGLGDNIAQFIGVITQPFIDVMEGENGNSSVLSKLIGTDFSISKAQEGAETVMTMGKSLEMIAKGASEMNDVIGKIELAQFSEDVATMTAAIPNAYLGITLPEDADKGKDRLEWFNDTVEMVQNNIDKASKLKSVAKSYDSIATSFSSMAASSATLKDNINAMEVEQLEGFSKLLINAKEFIMEAEDSSIESAVNNLGSQLSNVASTVSSFFGGGDDGEAGEGSNGALTKRDMAQLIQALSQTISQGDSQTVASLNRLRSKLDETLTVRDVT